MPRKRTAPSYLVRRRWTVVEAREALAALAASGLSAGAFARREGLDEERVYRWRRRLAGKKRAQPGPPAPAPELIEIRPHRSEPVEIVLASGRILRVSESIDPSALVRLVSALESGC